MISLGDILKDRLKDRAENPHSMKQYVADSAKDYQKKWAFGVQCFQKRINKDRQKENLKSIEFMAIRQKLVALYEINDLRWFYYHCEKYSRTTNKQGMKNTFSKCFFGALSLDKK